MPHGCIDTSAELKKEVDLKLLKKIDEPFFTEYTTVRWRKVIEFAIEYARESKVEVNANLVITKGRTFITCTGQAEVTVSMGYLHVIDKPLSLISRIN